MNKVISALKKEHLHLSTPVSSLKSLPSGKLELRTAGDNVETFDHVILACHSDTALKILKAGNISSEEECILSKFSWNKNEAVLHTDKQVSQSRLILVVLIKLNSL